MNDSNIQRRNAWHALLALWRRIRRKPQSPPDPYADRLVPVRRGPKGRSGAAVVEVEDDGYKSFFPPRRM